MIIGIDAKAFARQRTGIGMYLYSLVRELSLIDKNNNYILFSNRSFELDFELPNNWKIVIYKSRIGTFGVRYKLPHLLKNNKVNLFWGPDHALPKKSKNYKTVLTVHDLALFKFKNIGTNFNTFLMKVYLKRFCKEATAIICDSESTKKDVADIFRIENGKMSIVYPIPFFGFSNKLVGKTEKGTFILPSKYFLYIGTIEPRKNIITLLKAFDFLKNNYHVDQNIKLVLAGSKGWKSDNVYNYVANSKNGKDITFLGYVTDCQKNNLITNCSCFVFPSLYEGFGLPLLEAMSFGTICISSNISSLPEVGANGVLYLENTMDFEELAALMNKTLNMTQQSKEDLVRTAKEQANSFKIENEASKLLQVFNSYLSDIHGY